VDGVRSRLGVHPAAGWEVELVATKAGPDERRAVYADPGRGGPEAADKRAQVDIPGRWRPFLPDRLAEFLARDAPAALADQVRQRRPALATSELRIGAESLGRSDSLNFTFGCLSLDGLLGKR